MKRTQELADLARDLSNEDGVADTLTAAAHSALDLVEGCHHAAISVIHRRGRLSTEAATSDVARRADALQHEVDEGPLMRATVEVETVTSGDLTTEDRWPAWASRAADELGLRSVLSLQLYVSDHAIGVLSLYSEQQDAFDSEARHCALALAAHVAVALTAASNRAGLESALLTRVLIGQAQGRLMERPGLTAEQAFAVLKRVSQDRNVKLHRVAEDVAAHGADSDLLS